MNELYHFGIKGQKWGVRRYQNEDGTLTNAGKKRYNENYSPEQRLRDQMVYGKSGVKHINRTMNELGVGIQGARSVEADRINSTRAMATAAGQVGSTVGKVSGAIGGFLGSQYARNVLRNSSNPTMQTIAKALDDPMTNMIVSGAIATGSSSIGSILGRSGGRSIAMLSRGYSPSKYN